MIPPNYCDERIDQRKGNGWNIDKFDARANYTLIKFIKNSSAEYDFIIDRVGINNLTSIAKGDYIPMIREIMLDIVDNIIPRANIVMVSVPSKDEVERIIASNRLWPIFTPLDCEIVPMPSK